MSQILTANDHRLYYYTWPTDSGKHNYEIDFVLTHGAKICPVEVKSSGYNTHASLDAFRAKFSDRILCSYLVYTKDLRRDGDILLLRNNTLLRYELAVNGIVRLTACGQSEARHTESYRNS